MGLLHKSAQGTRILQDLQQGDPDEVLEHHEPRQSPQAQPLLGLSTDAGEKAGGVL